MNPSPFANFLELMSEDVNFGEKAKKILRLISEELQAQSWALMPLSETDAIEGFALADEQDEALLSFILSCVDSSVADNPSHVQRYEQQGFHCLARILRPSAEARAVLVLGKLSPWSESHAQEVEHLARQFERELEHEAMKVAEGLKQLWLDRLELLEANASTAAQKIDEAMRIAKGLLGLESCALWRLDGTRVSFLIKEQETPESPLCADHSIYESLAQMVEREPFFYHTPKMRQQLVALPTDHAPACALVAPFVRHGAKHTLTFFSKRARALSFKDEEIWVAKHCARWVADHLDLLNREENDALIEMDKSGALDASSEALITLNGAGKVIFFNQAASRLLGVDFNETRSRHISEILTLLSLPHATPITLDPQEWMEAGSETAPWGKEATLCSQDATRSVVECRLAPLRRSDGGVIGIALALRDVTEARVIERQILYHRDYDALTGLLNRESFFQLLTAAMQSARFGHEHALIYLDLDHIKALNDTHGHSAGDALLKVVAQLLAAEFGERAVIARFGADEFVLLIEFCPLNEAIRFATRARDAISKIEFIWQAKRFPVSASLGLTGIDRQRASVEEIVADADAACYGAKLKGRNQVKVSQQEDIHEIQQRRQEMEWALELNTALNESRLLICMQTILPLSSSPAPGLPLMREALLRLRLPNGKEASPGSFMDVAERYNIAPKIDRWVCEKLLTHPESTRDAAFPQTPAALDWQININLSGASLNDPSFLPFLQELIAPSSAWAPHFCFEITETAAVRSLGAAANLLREIKALGFKIALDDFGAGMSSFAYLKHFPADFIKIDGALVKAAPHDRIAAVIIKTIAQACAELGLAVIAESVETAEIASLADSFGITWGQGFHLAMPLPLPAHSPHQASGSGPFEPAPSTR